MYFQLIQAIKMPIYGIKLIAPGNNTFSKRKIKAPFNGKSMNGQNSPLQCFCH